MLDTGGIDSPILTIWNRERGSGYRKKVLWWTGLDHMSTHCTEYNPVSNTKDSRCVWGDSYSVEKCAIELCREEVDVSTRPAQRWEGRQRPSTFHRQLIMRKRGKHTEPRSVSSRSSPENSSVACFRETMNSYLNRQYRKDSH